MFDMEPVFKVDKTKFIYTFEDVWIQPGQTKIKKDTLLIGGFRLSSIDSINNLINQLKDSVIYNVGNYLSGSAACIEISNDKKKIKFDLHNASDSTADKIVAILNTYIPAKMNKLSITQ